jgi:hypothetical protein
MIRSAIFAITLVALAPAAQAQIDVRIGLPVVRFETAPPLVVVRPGVQVVRDYDEEVFYTGGWYWVRHGGGWYRARDWRGGWVVAEPRYVPRTIVGMPPGHYRRFQGRPHRFRAERHHVEHDHRRPPARADFRPDHRGDERDHDRGRGHDHGKGRGHDKDHGRGKARGHGKH